MLVDKHPQLMRTRHSPYFQPPTSARRERLSILIAYDDLAAGHRAMQLYSNLATEFPDLCFQAVPWRFDVLSNRNYREHALADALKANLIIIVASALGAFSEEVQNWAKESFAGRTGTHTAVIVLIDEQQNLTPITFLRNAAAEAGLDFFAPGPWSGGNDVAENITPTLKEYFHSPPTRHWGINE